MSVLRHGGSYLQRRLTKMYSDTKTSCESVTTASKPNDDPELVALHRNYRIQKDRLLAWGLDWSDASAAQPNDIDESLTEAGFSDVVASVMSSIQELLNEAERLQHVGGTDLPPKGSQGDLPAKDNLSNLPAKTRWTDEDINRSNALLKDLTACIDTLYDLSQSRRNMSMSMSSTGQTSAKPKLRPTPTPRGSKSSEDHSYSFSGDGKLQKEFQGSIAEPLETVSSPKQQQEVFEHSPFTNFKVAPTAFAEKPGRESAFDRSFSSTKHLFIDRSALQLSGASHAKSPPPYEVIAASANSRVIGRMKTEASPFLSSLTSESTVPILAEFTPMMLETQNAITVPASQRLEELHRSLDQLVENARVSHLGLLRFLGYYIDMPNSRYAFIYQMPMDYFPFLRNPSDLMKELKPKPLVSLFHSGDDHQDIPVPNLENRFRLGYNLILSMLHLRSQNIVHGNINSSNILVFPGLNESEQNEIGNLTEDLRHPYLTSFAQFSGDGLAPEPLSSGMYRHPDDKRLIDDNAAWAYDLYSLGLVLLEIGLWTPISRLWKMKYNNAMFKQRIENVYIKKLGAKCGTAYLHMVQLCLDAPNFHLSPEPMGDLNLRVPEICHYPAQALSESDGAFAFSLDFLYTISKIIWRCCLVDIFDAPPAGDLDEKLPIALPPSLTREATTVRSTDQMEPFQTHPPVEQNSRMPLGDVKISKIDDGDKKSKKRSLKKLTNIEIPQQHLDEWNFNIMPRLSKLLQKVLKDSSESCSANLMVTGDGVESAKTTICVTCSNVKKVRAALKKYFVIDKDGWDLIVLRGDIKRSKVPHRRRRKAGAVDDVHENHPMDLNPYYQQKPVCGASIGAFRNEEHLPPVSYGGAILVDGMPFGMTVHHMLDAPSDDEEYQDEDADCPPRSAANGQRGIEPSSADFAFTWCEEDLPETNYEFEITDDEDDDRLSHGMDETFDDHWLSDDYSSDEEGFDGYDSGDDDDTASIGDTAGVEPGEEPQLIVTQPAIDDIHEDFFPCPEDRDDEHLASHSLGYVHASSGVKRWTRKGMKHEIDWALIKMHDNRMDTRNVVSGRPTGAAPQGLPQRHGPGQDVHLNRVARLEELGGLKVHCCGRTSGLQSGQISKAMTLVKMHGRHSFSTSFCVDGNFGVPGDSGAWVFDKATGRVCGHVLAWSEKNRVAYIAPMEVLLEDIARTLGATKVTLPGGPEEPVAPAVPQPAAIESYSRRRQPHVQLMADRLPAELGRLSLGGFDEPALSRVGTGRGLRDVSSTYRTVQPLVTQTRGLGRQLA
ncbi:hypothetical protein DTO169C6_2901 [Paecilomyces variotii]|nr:hypothetical protein DTO169C6_2901 [Paecilomyces variotii]KAJ9384147.1 hypothetical protein DTO063F5_4880 [Paecilomyces variotii]